MKFREISAGSELGVKCTHALCVFAIYIAACPPLHLCDVGCNGGTPVVSAMPICLQVGLLTSMLYSAYGLSTEGQQLMLEHSPTLELLLQVPELAAAFQAGVDANK